MPDNNEFIEEDHDEYIQNTIDNMNDLTELDVEVAMNTIKNSEYDQLPIQIKDDIRFIILKALDYYKKNKLGIE